MAPVHRHELTQAERDRVTAIFAKAHALYQTGLDAGPTFEEDPLGAAAWRFGLRSNWQHRFNVDSLLAIRAGLAAGLSWRDLVIAAGLPEGEENRFRSRQSWRLKEYDAYQAGDPIEEEDEEAGDGNGGMPGM